MLLVTVTFMFSSRYFTKVHKGLCFVALAYMSCFVISLYFVVAILGSLKNYGCALSFPCVVVLLCGGVLFGGLLSRSVTTVWAELGQEKPLLGTGTSLNNYLL